MFLHGMVLYIPWCVFKRNGMINYLHNTENMHSITSQPNIIHKRWYVQTTLYSMYSFWVDISVLRFMIELCIATCACEELESICNIFH